MDPSLGARLKAQRERQQVALSTISNDTKIKLSILEGLERDDVSHWPEGIYRRAYVRAYARAIGLDPETLVREFLEAHPEPVVAPPDTQTELENPQWPAGIRRLVTSAIAAVPSRLQRDGVAAEAIHVELNRPPAAVYQEQHVGLESEVSAIAGDADQAVRDRSVAPEPGPSAGDLEPADDGGRRPDISLRAAAALCTRLGQLLDRREVGPILADAARALDAVGLVVWSWDSPAAALRPWVAHGYSDAALARMPKVRADSDNAVAAVFRSARARVIDGGEGATGAVVVPLLAHRACVGVLAVELQHGDEQRELVHAFVTILAAPFVSLVAAAPLAEAVNA